MNETPVRQSLYDRIRWWLYEHCFAYCVSVAYPDADPSKVCLLDEENFIAIEKDEVRQIAEEHPDLAWRFDGLLTQYQPECK